MRKRKPCYPITATAFNAPKGEVMDRQFTAYKSRPIRFLELWEHEGWKIKIYGICSLAEKPQSRFVKIAKEIAAENLPVPALGNDRYGVAFVTIHQARMFNQIILDWWGRENELRHHVFKANAETPYSFKNITVSGEAFCVWELRVIGFERDAWLNAVLKNSGAPNIEKYLNLRLNEDV